MREWEVGIQFHRLRERAKSILSPLRMRQTKLVAPVTWLECHRAPRGGKRLIEPSGTDEEERQRRVRHGKMPLELDRASHMIDRAREKRGFGLAARSRHLVLPESRVRETDVCQRIPRIENDGALEVSDGA